MLYMKPLTFAAACTFLVSTGLPFLFAKPASAITFNTSISLLESDVLPPWDVPEVGRGNFEFDGSTNTYGNFVIEDLLFLNFGTFGDGPWTTLFPNNHPVPYPPNTRSLLTPIVFTPIQVTSANASEFIAEGNLDFVTSVGIPQCFGDPIASGGALCGAKFDNILLNLAFDNPIFLPATNQYVASNFQWSLTTTIPIEIDLPGDRPILTILPGTIIAAGTNVDIPGSAFPTGFVVPGIVPANRAQPVPEPSIGIGIFFASISIFRSRKKLT